MKNTINLKPEERQACEIWTRVMGYHRPTSSFNKGKKGEHAERLHFKEAPSPSTPSLSTPVICPS